LDFTLTKEQTANVWSSDVSINAFTKSTAVTYTSLALDDLFKGIYSIINDAQSVIESRVSAFDDAVEKLQTSLKAYRDIVESGIPR
jgi:hypothetical protein